MINRFVFQAQKFKKMSWILFFSPYITVKKKTTTPKHGIIEWTMTDLVTTNWTSSVLKVTHLRRKQYYI